MNAYLNGTFLPLNEAKVSALDRGFVFGDGVYEMLPVYSHKVFRLEAHLARLQTSLDGTRLANPHGLAHWRTLIEQLIAAQPFADQAVYLQITRGTPGDTQPPRDHAFPLGMPPTVFMYTQPLVPASAAQKMVGVHAITVPDLRWGRCDLKTISLLANVLARQQAVEAGCAEAVLLRDGWLTEGAASTIFVVKDSVLCAPPPSPRMLPGITGEVVLELAAAHGIPHVLRDLSEADVRGADELWMTSSTKEIMPIVRLDDTPVGAGVAGPLARQMDALYQQFKLQVMRA